MHEGGTCVFLFSLPPVIDERALGQICGSYGEVQSCQVVPNDCSGATNVGFVNMTTSDQARETVRALNGAKTELGLLEVQAGPSVACDFHSYSSHRKFDP